MNQLKQKSTNEYIDKLARLVMNQYIESYFSRISFSISIKAITVLINEYRFILPIRITVSVLGVVTIMNHLITLNLECKN